MSDQLDFGEALARNTDPETSHDAADSMAGQPASKAEKVVLDLLSLSPEGLTSHELVDRSGLPWNTVTPRIRPLIRKGLACDSGIRRPGPSGRSCIVWKSVISPAP